MRPDRALRTVALVLGVSHAAHAFPHVVAPGDTLASIAETYYGRIQHERILVVANGLEALGAAIVPGMVLSIPALGHRRIRAGDSWAALASELLGSAGRADVLSLANASSPWLTPEEGTEIVIPYNLPVSVGPADTTVTIAYRFLGDMNKAWELDHYNALSGRALQRGEVLLVPLLDLALTEGGRAKARAAAGSVCSESQGDARTVQKRVEAELPQLIGDVRAGRYVDAVTRGNRLLAMQSLTRVQLARVQRLLVDAYAALDAPGQAATACSEWRKADPRAVVDAVLMSPKLVSACARGGGA